VHKGSAQVVSHTRNLQLKGFYFRAGSDDEGRGADRSTATGSRM